MFRGIPRCFVFDLVLFDLRQNKALKSKGHVLGDKAGIICRSEQGLEAESAPLLPFMVVQESKFVYPSRGIMEQRAVILDIADKQAMHQFVVIEEDVVMNTDRNRNDRTILHRDGIQEFTRKQSKMEQAAKERKPCWSRRHSLPPFTIKAIIHFVDEQECQNNAECLLYPAVGCLPTHRWVLNSVFLTEITKKKQEGYTRRP